MNDIAKVFWLHENGVMEAIKKWVEDELALMKQAQQLMEG